MGQEIHGREGIIAIPGNRADPAGVHEDSGFFLRRVQTLFAIFSDPVENPLFSVLAIPVGCFEGSLTCPPERLPRVSTPDSTVFVGFLSLLGGCRAGDA
jgi:hypothetical protein